MTKKSQIQIPSLHPLSWLVNAFGVTKNNMRSIAKNAAFIQNTLDNVTEDLMSNDEHMLTSKVFLRYIRKFGTKEGGSIFDASDDVYAGGDAVLRFIRMKLTKNLSNPNALFLMSDIISLYLQKHYKAVDSCAGSYQEEIARSYFDMGDRSVFYPEETLLKPPPNNERRIQLVGAAVHHISRTSVFVEPENIRYALSQDGYRKSTRKLPEDTLNSLRSRPKGNRNIYTHGFARVSNPSSALNSILVLWSFALSCETIIDLPDEVRFLSEEESSRKILDLMEVARRSSVFKEELMKNRARRLGCSDVVIPNSHPSIFHQGSGAGST